MKHTVVAGHYGVGKTNVSVNLALKKAQESDMSVYLIDLDVVNPFFRSSDCGDLLTEKGISLISPVFAGSNLDAPSLPPSIQGVFSRNCTVVWDVGGDDSGSCAIGRYKDKIKADGYEMLYVINMFRPLTETYGEMKKIMYEIEAASGLRFTGIINNSNLGGETTAEDIARSCREACVLSDETGLKVKFTSVMRNLINKEEIIKENENLGNIMFLEDITKKYW